MTRFSTPEAIFLGTVLEGIFYGIYCIVFALYIRIHKSSSTSFLRYPLSALFILCTIFVPLDFTQQFITIFRGGGTQITPWKINLVTSTIYSFVDVISQGILIYRCWVMWDGQLLLVIVPSILAFTSFATSIALVGELDVMRDHLPFVPAWFFPLGVASFSLSLAVNTIVTGLLVLKLVLVHREYVKTLPEHNFKGGHDLRPIISMLAESGMFTFVSQLIWVVLFRLQDTGFNSVGSPITMIYGITPTIIVVRVKMGTSYENKTSRVESTAMHFKVYNNGNSLTETATTGQTRVRRSTDDPEKN